MGCRAGLEETAEKTPIQAVYANFGPNFGSFSAARRLTLERLAEYGEPKVNQAIFNLEGEISNEKCIQAKSPRSGLDHGVGIRCLAEPGCADKRGER